MKNIDAPLANINTFQIQKKSLSQRDYYSNSSFLFSEFQFLSCIANQGNWSINYLNCVEWSSDLGNFIILGSFIFSILSSASPFPFHLRFQSWKFWVAFNLSGLTLERNEKYLHTTYNRESLAILSNKGLEIISRRGQVAHSFLSN